MFNKTIRTKKVLLLTNLYKFDIMHSTIGKEELRRQKMSAKMSAAVAILTIANWVIVLVMSLIVQGVACLGSESLIGLDRVFWGTVISTVTLTLWSYALIRQQYVEWRMRV